MSHITLEVLNGLELLPNKVLLRTSMMKFWLHCTRLWVLTATLQLKSFEEFLWMRMVGLTLSPMDTLTDIEESVLSRSPYRSWQCGGNRFKKNGLILRIVIPSAYMLPILCPWRMFSPSMLLPDRKLQERIIIFSWWTRSKNPLKLIQAGLSLRYPSNQMGSSCCSSLASISIR